MPSAAPGRGLGGGDFMPQEQPAPHVRSGVALRLTQSRGLRQERARWRRLSLGPARAAALALHVVDAGTAWGDIALLDGASASLALCSSSSGAVTRVRPGGVGEPRRETRAALASIVAYFFLRVRRQAAVLPRLPVHGQPTVGPTGIGKLVAGQCRAPTSALFGCPVPPGALGPPPLHQAPQQLTRLVSRV